MPIVAADIRAQVIQPSDRSSGELTRASMTVRSLIKRVMSATRGGARAPLSTAAQTSIFSALMCTRLHPSARQPIPSRERGRGTGLLAFRSPVSFGVLIAGYAVGTLLVNISITPSGLGPVEGMMI